MQATGLVWAGVVVAAVLVAALVMGQVVESGAAGYGCWWQVVLVLVLVFWVAAVVVVAWLAVSLALVVGAWQEAA